MKYFQHSSQASQDEKLIELFIKFSFEGIGLFWTIIEKLAAAEKPIKLAVLKKLVFSAKKHDKIWQFLFEIQLIFIQDSTEVYSETIQKYIGSYETNKEKTAQRVSQHREKQRDKNNVTRYNNVTTENVTSQNKKENKNIEIEEKTKEKSDLENSLLIEENHRKFLETEWEWFWETYDKKRGESYTKFPFMKLTEAEVLKIRKHLPEYVASTKEDKMYRKDPYNYLTEKTFNDEIIKKNNASTNQRLDTKSTGAGRYHSGKDDGSPL